MIPTNKTNSSLSKPHGIAVSGDTYDAVIPYAGGLVQLAMKLAWYNGWKGGSSDVNPRLLNVTGGSAKKKSGKKSSTTYYLSAVDFILALMPVRGVLSFWYNNQKFICKVIGASGTIGTATDGSGNGVFSWTPSGTDSTTAYTGTVPSTAPYQVAVSGFVADLNLVKVNGRYLNPADPAYPPGVGQYTVDTAGNYNFNVAQAGGTLAIKYRLVSSGGSAILAGVLAAVVHEPFTANFNDYGAPGPVSVAGTWEQPLWNAGYPVPGRIDAGAYRARDPYSYWQPAFTGSTIYFPAALIGKPVTVYYAVPEILKSDGSFYSDTMTPAQLLNLEFEPEFGEGAEYAAFSAQQIINSFAAGMGSTALDLGASNAVPSLLVETIGMFAQFANGDGEVADFLTDLVMSGPTLIPQETHITQCNPTAYSVVGPPATNGTVSGVSNSGGTITFLSGHPLGQYAFGINWGGFTPPTIPSGMTIIGIYGRMTLKRTGAATFLETAAGTGITYGFAALSGGTPFSVPAGDCDTTTCYTPSLGTDLSILSTSEIVCSLWRSLSGSCDDVVSVSDVGFDIYYASAPLVLQPVGHGCNLNDYVGTPVPGQGNVLGDLTALRNYCRAYGITVALKLDSQRAAKDVLDELLLIANTAAVYSGKLLNFIPRCEVSQGGNGAVYTAPTAPVFALEDEDFVSDGKTPHIKFSTPRRAGCDNVYSVEFADRSIDYGTNVATDVDQRSVALYGPRKSGALDTAIIGQRPASGSQSLKSISNMSVALQVANVQARRSAAGLPPITFEILADNGHIEAMDVGTISSRSLGITPIAVRMKNLRETTKRTWQCEAEPFVFGLNQPRLKGAVAATGSLVTANIAVSSVNAPIIFEPPPAMLGAFRPAQLRFIVSDSDPNYGGCAVYMSADGGTTYTFLGMCAPCTTGVLTADYPVTGDPDTTHTLALDLTESRGLPQSVLPEKAAAHVDPCYIATASGGFEIVCPSIVTPGSGYTCTAGSYLRRGVFGTAIADHPSGARFGVATGAFEWDLPASYVGAALYFKFPAINNVGGQQQDLSACTPYAYTPSGSGSSGSVFQVNGS